MKKILLLSSVLVFFSVSFLYSQGIRHTAWKSYYADPLNDTIVLHILQDSSFATGSKGDTLVISKANISADTLTFIDIGGMYQCAESDGVYRFSIQGDQIHFTLVRDGCEGRTAIANMQWARVADDSKKQK